MYTQHSFGDLKAIVKRSKYSDGEEFIFLTLTEGNKAETFHIFLTPESALKLGEMLVRTQEMKVDDQLTSRDSIPEMVEE